MNNKQRKVMIGICIYAFVWLMYHLTMVTKAYIGSAYPEISETMIANLVTLPNLAGIIASFVIGPIALKRSKSKIAMTALFSVFLYCIIFYFNGLFHGPFWLYIVACVFAGYGQGSYIPMLNGIINEHFPIDQIGDRIANYNVAINIGAVIILQAGGIIASLNGGTAWYNAYILGVFVLISLVLFSIVCKKTDIDTPTIKIENSNQSTIKDLPKSIIFWVFVMGIVHCFFYVTQYAFNTNVSTYIITEYQLGSATQVGTATSLTRFSLVIFTALYPFIRKKLKDWMIPIGYLSVGIGLTIMIVSQSLISVYICACFIGLSTSLAHSTLYAKAGEFVPNNLVPVAMSLVWGIANIGSATSVYILDFFANLIGGTMLEQMLVGIIISIIIAIFSVYLYVKKICRKKIK